MADIQAGYTLRNRTINASLPSKKMEEEQGMNDKESLMGDNQYQYTSKGDQNQYSSKGDNLVGEGISNMDVSIFGWKFNRVILVTHINIFLYATCFWIQTGTLPVGIYHKKCVINRQHKFCIFFPRVLRFSPHLPIDPSRYE